jgi:hypothetical protein
MDDELDRVLEAAFDGGNAAAKKVSDYIDKIMAGIPVWISVEDCLPEEGQLVLGFNSEWTECFAVVEYGDESGVVGPTNWMPLPAPPSDGK